MFKIQRFDFDNVSVNASGNSKNRLEQINGKIILKRKRASKEDLLVIDNITNNLLQQKQYSQTLLKETVLKDNKNDDNYNDDNSKNGKKEESLLQAFPRFHQQKLTPEEILSSKMLGIPDWLANPTIVNSSLTYSIDDNSLGLSEKLINRCKSLGITEFFAGTIIIIT
jgi:hypothetical protein